MNKNEKSIIERLLRIEQILRLRREEHSRLNEYNAGEVRHEKQLEFHRCAKRNNGYSGATEAAKPKRGRWNRCGWRWADTLSEKTKRT